jgi:outer membrane murein-binding lipoprotein Lpp
MEADIMTKTTIAIAMLSCLLVSGCASRCDSWCS